MARSPVTMTTAGPSAHSGFLPHPRKQRLGGPGFTGSPLFRTTTLHLPLMAPSLKLLHPRSPSVTCRIHGSPLVTYNFKMHSFKAKADFIHFLSSNPCKTKSWVHPAGFPDATQRALVPETTGSHLPQTACAPFRAPLPGAGLQKARRPPRRGPPSPAGPFPRHTCLSPGCFHVTLKLGVHSMAPNISSPRDRSCPSPVPWLRCLLGTHPPVCCSSPDSPRRTLARSDCEPSVGNAVCGVRRGHPGETDGA